MIARPSVFSSTVALAAALSMGAIPAVAADLPHLGSAHVSGANVEAETGAADDANQHRWRGRRHRDRGIDAGDVIAGVLVIGAIAAIAGAGRDRDRHRERDYRDRDYRDRDYPDRDYRGDDYRNDRRSESESRGMERAADMCVEQVERGRDRVEDISEARRTADGWRVSGTLREGDGWSCWIDNDGRIRNVDIGGPTASYDAGNDARDGGDARYAPASAPVAGEQWSDDAYTSARASVRTPGQAGYTYRDEAQTSPAAAAGADGSQPAYPGGPLPGEEGYGDAEDDGDGRYSTTDAPDFSQPGS